MSKEFDAIHNLRAWYKHGVDEDTAWRTIFDVLEGLDNRLTTLEHQPIPTKDMLWGGELDDS